MSTATTAAAPGKDAYDSGSHRTGGARLGQRQTCDAQSISYLSDPTECKAACSDRKGAHRMTKE